MKSLLKLSIICFLTFYATNTIQAQCQVGMHAPQKISEDDSSATYRFTATTASKVDRIKMHGLKTCYNTNYCTTTKRLPKKCGQSKTVLYYTESFKGACYDKDGCIVVISPGCGGL